MPERHMFHYVHSSLICDNQRLEQPRCPKIEEWIQKMWFIYRMEYNSAIKHKNILDFSDNWMELENIILREVT